MSDRIGEGGVNTGLEERARSSAGGVAPVDRGVGGDGGVSEYLRVPTARGLVTFGDSGDGGVGGVRGRSDCVV